MRIALFSDTYPPEINGVSTVTKTLFDIFTAAGHDVYVVTTATGKQKKAIVCTGKIITIKGVSLKKMYDYKLTRFFSPRGVKIIRRLNLDLIHVQTELGVGIFARIVAKLIGVPLIYTYHTMYEDYTYYVTKGKNTFDKFAKSVIRKFSKVLAETSTEFTTTSEKTRDILKTYGINKYINVVPNGIDLSSFTKEKQDFTKIQEYKNAHHLENKYLILSLGRIAQEKSIDIVLQGYANYLKSPSRQTHLLIVGDGPAKIELEELVVTLNIQEHVTFVGKVPHEEVAFFYNMADLFVSASVTETQGLTFLEAMAARSLTLACFDENLAPVIKEGITGFYFKGEEDFKDRLEYIINLSDEKKEIVLSSAEENIKQFSLEVFYERMKEVYERAIRKKW